MSAKEESVDPDLTDLLDEALQGFSTKAAKPAETTPSESVADASTSSNLPKPGPSSVDASQQPSTSTAPPSAKAGGLAFDPLGGGGSRKSRQSKPSAARITRALDNNEEQQQTEALLRELGLPPLEGLEGLGDEDMAAGLAKLLEELAKGDLGAPPVQQGSNQATSNPQGQQQDLSATLRALADQNPQFQDIPGQAQGGALSPEDEAMLHRLTEQLQGLAGSDVDASEGGASAGMTSLVDTIMAQLLSKDVLYEPMKDIGGRYPSWLAANKATLSPEEYRNYEEQYEYIQKICALFENDPNNFTELVNLLQEMQQRGQPPQEIVDELAPGMSFGPDGPLGNLEGLGGGGSGQPECCIS